MQGAQVHPKARIPSTFGHFVDLYAAVTRTMHTNTLEYPISSQNN